MGFAEFAGNQRVVTALQGMLTADRVPHAMLFSGPRGVGKYTLAVMFAQAANCARRNARRKFQTDGPAARLHPGWRGNHALGLGQYFPEDPGGAAGERHTDLAGAQPLPAAFDHPLALPAILLRAAEH